MPGANDDEPENTDMKRKVSIKFGDVEFSAEGDSSTIDDQLTAFKEMYDKYLSMRNSNATTQAPLGTEQANGSKDPSDSTGSDGALGNGGLEKYFKVDNDLVSLLAVPRTKEQASDCFVLLLFGYHRLANLQNVTGVRLNKSLKQSGINVDRVDRIAAARADLTLTAGARRAKTYRLNNRGVQEAQRLISEELN